jgi:hypothetical protein
MAYNSDKKPTNLNAATSVTGTNEIVVSQAGVVNKATLNQVESFIFSAKTQVTPVNGDAVIVRRGSDIRQLPVENMLPAGAVTNTMLAGSITDSKLLTISTAGKVLNSATTATSANTANAIVARDGSGNFTAGTITGTLSGNASTATLATNATTLATGRTIALTGDVTGTTGAFNGGSNVTAATTIANGAINNAKVASNAAIAGTKIVPNFGTQNVVANGSFQAQNATGSGDCFIIGNDSKLVDINVANACGLYGLANTAVGSLKLGSGGGIISGASNNIGIGTTSPSQAFHVVGSVLATPATWGSSGTAAVYLGDTNNYVSTLYNGPTTLAGFNGITFLAGSTLAERMRITLGGNLGLGLANPSARIHIYGPGSTSQNPSTSTNLGATIAVQDSGAGVGNGGMIMFGAAQGLFAAIKGWATDGGGNTLGSLVFCTRTNTSDSTLTERMVITAAGNVNVNGTVTASTVNASGYQLNGAAVPLVRAWARFDGVTANVLVTATASSGVSSISRTSDGVYRLTFSPPLPAGYAVSVDSGAALTKTIGLYNSTELSLECRTAGNNATNPQNINVIVVG